MTTPRDQFIPLAVLFRALADPVRLAIVNRLAGSGVPVGVLAGELGLAQATVSQHLAVLRQAGVVDSRREGRNMVYTLQSRRILELLGKARMLAQQTIPGAPPRSGYPRNRSPFQTPRGRSAR